MDEKIKMVIKELIVLIVTNMNWQQIIDLGRQLSFYTDTSEYTDAKALTDANIVYRDLMAQINQDVNEDLFADDFYFSTVAGQMEYSMPVVDNVAGTPWMDNLLWVFINYEVPVLWTWTVSTSIWSNVITWTGTTFTSLFNKWDHIIIWSSFYRVVSITSDTSLVIAPVDSTLPTVNSSWLNYYQHKVNYKKAYPERLSNLEFDQSYYGINQPVTNPFYIKYDTWIRIFPYATNSIVGAGKFYGTYDVVDLTLSSTPILDDNWHYVIAIWMKRLSYQRRWMHNEANMALQEYQLEYKKVINTLSDSDLSPLLRDLPNLTELQ